MVGVVGASRWGVGWVIMSGWYGAVRRGGAQRIRILIRKVGFPSQSSKEYVKSELVL